MSPGFRYGVGSVGALLLLFGAFLVVWRRVDRPGAGRRTHTGAWLILLVGAAMLALALAVPESPPPPFPRFLQR